MPIKYPFRAIAVGLLLAAGASPIVMAQNPTSSRRPKILERLPALVQENNQAAEEAVTVNAQEEASPVQQTAGVAPAKSTVKKSTGKTVAPKGMTSVSKAAKPSAQTASRQAPAPQAEVREIPAPDAVPSVPAEVGGAPSVTSVQGGATAKGAYKTTPTDVGCRGPYISQRIQYRRDQFKYRWDHYYKPGLQETHWGYPEEFCERPLGYYETAWHKTMVANAEASRMILHEMDFVQGEARLNERGREQLAKIAYMLPRNYFPLIIAQTGDNMTLSDARRTAILGLLTESGFPVPEQRVVLATPLARGLNGPEGEFNANFYYGSFQAGGVNYGFYGVFSDLQVGTFGNAGGGGGTTNAAVGGVAPGAR
jgi:hypothetical protein